ncbi:GDP-4-dehydro-6-deoxy-D-mannose reductase [Paenibacillus cellulosilyticus]|uniref:GDP-4-dehydro-6-deoxy-D-mannose reductase n=1 Tax=Paenibacillus cellulosilyticus TaxID=375489 RepID=A0A2V2YYC0_9BACL|nr:NAD-dependent epimerase/dehydratase family protein [Paenibacillus cellulosilyticus]PWW07344.1 GDP-4-dehydro-6-deoxy-D-mannose reductase [Paenibacillus cellulosilyticus]QKS44478.1 NAD-dependent epimerase/dehydratase family protein [Paenibacillus cellulosilyticus]
MNGMRVLVTGAGGFCGEHAVAYFLQRGWEVIAAVSRRKDRGAASSSNERGYEVIACDWTDWDDARRVVAQTRPDAVIHLAGLNAAGGSWLNPAAYLMTNAMGTVHLLEAVRAADRPCRVLVAGSMLRFRPSEDRNSPPAPPHPYSLSKTIQVLVSQSWSSLYGMDVIVAEPSNLIGPGRSQGLCALLARYTAQSEAAEAAGETVAPFRLSSRDERRDFLDVRDAMAAYEALLRSGVSGLVYPVASGQFVTLEQLSVQFTTLAHSKLAFEIGDSAAPSPDPVDLSGIYALGWQARIPLAQSIMDALDDARAILAQGGRG